MMACLLSAQRTSAHECMTTRNFIAVGNQYACIRELTSAEVRATNKREGLIHLEHLERVADQDVESGFSPSVSVGEFSRRLDVRSQIWDAQRNLRYSD